MTMSELLTTRSSIPLGRRRLATVLRQAGDLVRTTDVVSALDVNRSAASKLFGTRFVWRSRSRVVLSDIHRTIVDMLDDPAVGSHDEISETWVFKGGTCLKKCFFETYRFSEDLDFTLTSMSPASLCAVVPISAEPQAKVHCCKASASASS